MEQSSGTGGYNAAVVMVVLVQVVSIEAKHQ